ncbi:septum formation inhibitor Maf [Candidatus Woesebacteria bacterium]|nr:septum formation inhibitor Maf [Candidatus Woesebacteria bacterium]
MKRIILASGSPRRKEILEKSGLVFEVIPSKYEENMSDAIPPMELAKKLSLGKASDVADSQEGAVVIGADTFIAFEGKVLGKPINENDAKEMLKRMSGKSHSVITGFTIIDTDSKQTLSHAVETKVYFKKLTNEEIDSYVSTGEPLDKAGSYAIQGLGAILVEKIEGDYFNVMGLPLNSLVEKLKEFDIFVLK